MVYENELAMLFIGMWVLFYIRKVRFTDIPESGLFLAGFFCLVLSWCFTILESFIFPDILNFLEHLCYALSSFILMLWYLKNYVIGKKTQP